MDFRMQHLCLDLKREKKHVGYNSLNLEKIRQQKLAQGYAPNARVHEMGGVPVGQCTSDCYF